MKGLLQLFICLILFHFVEAQKDCRHGEYELQTIAAHPQLSRSALASARRSPPEEPLLPSMSVCSLAAKPRRWSRVGPGLKGSPLPLCPAL